jgi:hypothetical protein
LHIVVSNAYCVAFLFCFSLCCQFLWIVHATDVVSSNLDQDEVYNVM